MGASPVSSMPEKKRKNAVWEWKDDKGNWNELNEDDSAMLEARFTENPTDKFTTIDFSFNKIHKTKYHISFVEMTQTNGETNVARQLRRAGGGPPKTRAKKTEKPTWAHKGDDGKWHNFDDADAQLLEAEYLARGPKGKFSSKELSFSDKTTYSFDFGAKTQTNDKT